MNRMIPLILATAVLAFAGCSTLKKLRPEASLDQVTFDQLQWTYGGVDGSRAKLDKVTLSDLRLDARHCWYTWKVGLDAWGMAPTHADALACAFVRTPSGWKGGKRSNVITGTWKR